MEFIMEIINTYGMEIIGAIITALAGVMGLAARNLATKYINTKIKKHIAQTVVQGVEQLYQHLNGEKKLAIALDTAAEMLAGQGINVTDLELRMLLEAAVGEFNNVFNAGTILPETIMQGYAVEDLTDEQLREVAVQAGLSRSYVEGRSRDELLAALDELADAALV